MNSAKWTPRVGFFALLKSLTLFGLSGLLLDAQSKETLPGPFFNCKRGVLRQEIRRYQPGWKNLTPAQVEFIETQILPVLGERFLFKARDEFRTCSARTDFCMLDDFGGKRLKIEWDNSLTEPEIKTTAFERILRINTKIRLTEYPQRGSDWLYHWTMGTSLHPFTSSKTARTERIALGEPEFLYKGAQIEAISAIDAALVRHRTDRRFRKFKWVSPTGVGKTEALKHVIKKQLLDSRSTHRMHIVLADQDFIVRQLAEELESLHNSPALKKHPFQLVKWGGEDGSIPLEQLMESHRKADMPMVLVSTIQSLMAQIKKEPVASIRRLRSELRTLAVDESHHSGAKRGTFLIDELIDHPQSKAFLYGTSATPVHETVNIDKLYDGNLFWAYLDDPKTFWKHRYNGRDLKDVVTQLTTAIDRGELTPIKRFYRLREEDILGPKRTKNTLGIFRKVKSLMDTNSERYTLNPRYVPKVVDRILPIIERHKQGFITAATIDEADTVLRALQSTKTKKRFEVMHSKQTFGHQEDIKRKFRDGEIDFVITVRQLDEGVNFPNMSLYVDLNRDTGPRQIVQRLGRILRLSPGKESVEVVTLFNVSEDTVAEGLQTFSQLISHQAKPRTDRELAAYFLKRDRMDSYKTRRREDDLDTFAERFFANKLPAADDIEYHRNEQQTFDELKAFLLRTDLRGPKAIALKLKRFVDEQFRLPLSTADSAEERKLYASAIGYFKHRTPEFMKNLDEGTKLAIQEWRMTIKQRRAYYIQGAFGARNRLPAQDHRDYAWLRAHRKDPEVLKFLSNELKAAIIAEFGK